MIRIAEHDLCLHLRNPLSRDSLDRRSSTDRHKNRCLNHPMWSFENSSTGKSVSSFNVEFKDRIRHYSCLIFNVKFKNAVFFSTLHL